MASLLKKMLPRTLFGRSLMIIVTPILLIQIITIVIFFDRHWVKMTDRLAYSVAGEIAVVAHYLEQGMPEEEFTQVTANMARSLDLLMSYDKEGVFDDREVFIPIGRSWAVSKTLSRAMERQVRRPYKIEVKAEERWVEVTVELSQGLLHVSLPERRLFSSSGYIFVLYMIGVSLVLLVIAIIFMRNQIRPIHKLAIAAARMGKGQPIPPSFKPQGAYEVRQAAKAFIDMHERITRQIEQRTTMLAGVSHDLRTPLTRMKLQVEMLGEGQDRDDLKSDIFDMERMIDAYLDFARQGSGEVSERIDVVSLVDNIITKAQREGYDVHWDMVEEALPMSLKPVAFERAISNIISNARKYAEHIWVNISKEENQISLVIEDDGPGIAEDKFNDVFKPFYRDDLSRNIAAGSVGLGLPIAQDIVHSHGGEITLGQSPHGGLKVTIILPL